MRSLHRVTLAVVTLVATTVPAMGQQSPRIVSRAPYALTLDLPAAQTVLILGVSLYGDVMLLYPGADSPTIVEAGRRVLPLNQAGPWIAGGGKDFVQSTSGPQSHCFPDESRSMIAQREKDIRGTEGIHYCTELPRVTTGSLEGPKLLHLVVVGTDSLTEMLDLNPALDRFEPKGKSRDIAAALARRFNAVSPSHSWWGLGMSWYAKMP